jgi:hypothetical protein
MDDDEDFGPEVFTHFVFSIKVVRVLEDLIIPSTLKFKMEFIPMDTADDTEIDLSFTKMRYWLDNVINKSVIFAHDNSTAITMFIDQQGADTRIGNILVLTPHEPTDQHIAALFQAKMQALAGGSMAFGPVEVSSDNQLGLVFTFVGDSSAVLPGIADWVGERSFFDKPWWDRDDGSTLDVMPPDDADLSVPPSWAFNFDFLDKPKKESKAEGQIVRPDFRPKVIDGGKGKE